MRPGFRLPPLKPAIYEIVRRYQNGLNWTQVDLISTALLVFDHLYQDSRNLCDSQTQDMIFHLYEEVRQLPKLGTSPAQIKPSVPDAVSGTHSVTEKSTSEAGPSAESSAQPIDWSLSNQMAAEEERMVQEEIAMRNTPPIPSS